jgi:NAD dependent epimerase/dehydratase
MKIENNRILVTGAGGFVGSHLVEKLVQLGGQVICFIRYTSRDDCGLLEKLPRKILNEVKIISGDLRDPYAVGKATRDIKIVFHLGALIGIPYSYLHPREVIETNVMGTLNVMQAALHQGVSRVIHTSSSEVYGTARYVPIDENHPLQGQSPYSASKIGADKIAESFYRSFGLPVSMSRPFNIYGPRQSTRAVIPTIIAQALADKKIKLGSLKPIRDFTFVNDTVEGFVKIAESQKTVGEVLNLGTGTEISIGDLVKKIGDILEKEIRIEQDPVRVRPEESEVERLICDNTKAKKILNWEPKVSLGDGLLRTIEWIRQSPDYYRRIKQYTV